MGQLATFFFPELDGVVVSWVRNSSYRCRDADVLHEPYPLTHWRSPYFLISPANLRWPVRSIVVALGFNPHRQSAHHLTRTDAVERCPVITLAVHQTGGERIAT